MSRASGFQGSRVNGSQGLNGFKGPKSLRVSVSRVRGIPHVNRGFQKSGVPKIQRLRVQGMKALSGLQGPRFKGIKGSWVPVDPKVLKDSRA